VGGETAPHASPWHETKEPGVYLDTRLLPWQERVKRLARISLGFFGEIRLYPHDDETAYQYTVEHTRAVNQRILEQHPYAGSPNPPFQQG